jgi:subtilisin family serine protease
MAVGATNQNDNRISYSNYSNKLDVVAPSAVPVANAPSAYINSNYYGSAGGTSLSTPHVAGLASLLKGNDPTLSRTQITNLIKNRADKVAGMQGKMFHKQYGYGRINLYVPLNVTEGRLPAYRLYHSGVNNHFFTISAGERNKAINKLGYRDGGVGFRVLNQEDPLTIPVYRLYHSGVNNHFFTISAGERNKAINKLGYRDGGVGFRAE